MVKDKVQRRIDKLKDIPKYLKESDTVQDLAITLIKNILKPFDENLSSYSNNLIDYLNNSQEIIRQSNYSLTDLKKEIFNELTREKENRRKKNTNVSNAIVKILTQYGRIERSSVKIYSSSDSYGRRM